ncbi:hypothetical protein MRX96_005796 [Rhipicephalus microplus]
MGHECNVKRAYIRQGTRKLDAQTLLSVEATQGVELRRETNYANEHVPALGDERPAVDDDDENGGALSDYPGSLECADAEEQPLSASEVSHGRIRPPYCFGKWRAVFWVASSIIPSFIGTSHTRRLAFQPASSTDARCRRRRRRAKEEARDSGLCYAEKPLSQSKERRQRHRPPSEAERVSRHTAINVCGCRRGVPPWSWPRGGKKNVACVVTRDVTRSLCRCAIGARNEGGQAFLPVPSSSAISISYVVLTGGTRNRMKVPPAALPCFSRVSDDAVQGSSEVPALPTATQEYSYTRKRLQRDHDLFRVSLLTDITYKNE